MLYMYIFDQQYYFDVPSFLLITMKKLIQNNIAKEYNAKSTRFLNVDTEVKIQFSQPTSEKQDEPKFADIQLRYNSKRILSSKKVSQRNLGTYTQNKLLKQNINNLQQKYNTQQVSSLYSQHIYKSNQRDYILQAQLQKYKLLLENEKKIKLKLLSQQNDWKIEKAKLLQQKQIILFALDSLTVKFDSQQQMKKNRQIRRRTAQIFKSKFYGNQILTSFQKDNLQKGKASLDNLLNQSIEKIGSNQEHSHWQKLKLIRNLKNKLNISHSSQKDNMLDQHQKNEQKFKQMELLIKQANKKIQQLQSKINIDNVQQKQKRNFDNQLIEKLKQQNFGLCKKILNIQQDIRKTQKINRELSQKIKNLENIEEVVNAENKRLQQKINLLQKELKITHQEYNQRQERQKLCVKILQKFAQDLKLSDQKIQQFLKAQVQNYQQGNPQNRARTIKSYNQHISYILHLCKKKETVYEHLIQQLKQKIKEDDFRSTILQKKLNNFIKYQESLRLSVLNQSNKQLVFRTILRFGH